MFGSKRNNSRVLVFSLRCQIRKKLYRTTATDDDVSCFERFKRLNGQKKNTQSTAIVFERYKIFFFLSLFRFSFFASYFSALPFFMCFSGALFFFCCRWCWDVFDFVFMFSPSPPWCAVFGSVLVLLLLLKSTRRGRLSIVWIYTRLTYDTQHHHTHSAFVQLDF